MAALVLAALWPAPAAAASGPLPRLALSLPSSSAKPLDDATRCGVAGCIVVAPPIDLLGTELPDKARLEQMVAALPSGFELLLHVRLPERPRSASAAEDQDLITKAAERLVRELPLASPGVRGIIVEVPSPAGDPSLLQFAVAALALQAKSSKPGSQVIVAFPPGVLPALDESARRIAAYSDAVGVTLGNLWRDELAFVASRLQRPVFLQVPEPASAGAGDLMAAYLDALLEADELSIDTVWIRGGAGLAGLCRSLAFLGRSIPTAFVPAQSAGSPASIEIEGAAAPRVLRFVGGQSADVAMLVKAGGGSGSPRSLIVSHAQSGFEVSCYDVADGRRLPVEPAGAGGQGTAVRCRADAAYVLVMLHRTATDERVVESVSVTGRAELRVEEIIARWQEYREVQRRLLRNYQAACLLSLHFEQAGLGSGFDVSVQLREFVAGPLREWIQDDFYVNGVRFGNRKGFPLPQLEPEKVVTQPLELSIDERYRYELEGIDNLDGTFCYVVRIEPTRADETLYSGKIWIDGATFRQVRLQLQQRGGRTNIVSHVETQDFQLVAAGEQQFNLLRSIDVQQVLNAAGRSLLLEKRYRFSDYKINTDDFEALASAARESNNPMFRDTTAGLRALKKEGGERVVETVNTSRMRSLLTGVFYEGTFDVPIPMAGLSLVDFDYRGSGAQVSLFFAGPIVALNVSKQRTERFRVGLDVALSGLPQQNRVYRGDQEAAGEGVWSFEETIGGLASWQATPSWSLTASTHLAVNLFRGTSDQVAGFVVPSHGGTVYVTGESKITKKGYSITTAVMGGSRLGWSSAVGVGGSERLAPRYLKYYVEAGKQFYIGSFTKAVLTASYYDGTDLDRFSRYQPSFLSRPRIRGIPSGVETFDEVGVVGASYGFNVMEMVKLEGIYNHAWGRNKSESDRFRTYDGLELDIGTAAPWGTFVQGTVAYALRGATARYDNRWAVYLLVFKPL